MNHLQRINSLNDDYFEKSLEFKNIIDDFSLIKNVNDVFFIELYKKNFLLILDFEIKNNFNYSKNDIYNIEQELEDIIINNKKYNQIFDYMILKSSDAYDYYGSIINFILFLFKEIKYHLSVLNQIHKIWDNDYKHIYDKFSDFKKSKDFELVSLKLITQKYDKDLEKVEDYYDENKSKLDFSNVHDVCIFLIFASINSDFYIKGLGDENINQKLFENQNELYKKNGYKMLENLKNKIISYN